MSRQRDLFLDLTEMQTIQKYYRGLKREPTDVELETHADMERALRSQDASQQRGAGLRRQAPASTTF